MGGVASAATLLLLDLQDAGTVASQGAQQALTEPPIVFEFWEDLPSERVGPAPEPAAPQALTETAATPQPAATDDAPAAATPDAPLAATPDAPAAPDAPLAAKPAPPSPAAAEADARVEFLLQAGAFRQASAARKRQAALLLAGMAAEIRSMKVDDGMLYRVIVGPFPDRNETRRAMDDLRARHIAPFLIKRAVQAG